MDNHKIVPIIKHCKYTHFYTYSPCGRLPIYRKAINYTEVNIYSVASFHTRHRELEYSFNSAMSLYYGSEIYDTMFDKCLNEQDDY